MELFTRDTHAHVTYLQPGSGRWNGYILFIITEGQSRTHVFIDEVIYVVILVFFFHYYIRSC